jgi:hypothetical protein
MNAQCADDVISMGRGSPKQLRVFLFLASDLAACIMGAAVDINGGMHIHRG